MPLRFIKRHEFFISTYHKYINEAIYTLRYGLNYYEEAKLVPRDVGSDDSMIIAEINCRYSFLMIVNSLEAAANALLLSLKLDNEYYEKLERKSTLGKFKFFCDKLGIQLDQGDIKYARIKELIFCRNEFVHPKPRIVNYNIDSPTSDIKYDVKSTKNIKYPLYFNEIKPQHVLNALEDALGFISWVCFDVCKLEIQDGALKLGCGSYGNTGDILKIELENNIKFDK